MILNCSRKYTKLSWIGFCYCVFVKIIYLRMSDKSETDSVHSHTDSVNGSEIDLTENITMEIPKESTVPLTDSVTVQNPSIENQSNAFDTLTEMLVKMSLNINSIKTEMNDNINSLKVEVNTQHNNSIAQFNSLSQKIDSHIVHTDKFLNRLELSQNQIDNKVSLLEAKLNSIQNHFTTELSNNQLALVEYKSDVDLKLTQVDESIKNLESSYDSKINKAVHPIKCELNELSENVTTLDNKHKILSKDLENKLHIGIDKVKTDFEKLAATCNQKGSTIVAENSSFINYHTKRKPHIFNDRTSDPMLELECIKQYINSFGEDYCNQGPWTIVKNLISNCFQNASRSWFIAIYDSLTSWQVFEQQFKSIYWNECKQRLARISLESSKYQPHKKQGIVEYFQVKYSICKHAYPNLSEPQRIQILSRHYGPTIQSSVLVRQISDYNMMISLLMEFVAMGVGEETERYNYNDQEFRPKFNRNNNNNNFNQSNNNNQRNNNNRNSSFYKQTNFNNRQYGNNFRKSEGTFERPDRRYEPYQNTRPREPFNRPSNNPVIGQQDRRGNDNHNNISHNNNNYKSRQQFVTAALVEPRQESISEEDLNQISTDPANLN